jgi:DNA-binding transcriptional ArsR family regulator
VRKWLARFRAGGQAALANRASATAGEAGRLPDRRVALALHLRRQLRLTGAEIARKLGLARSTVSRWLKREGLGRLADLDPPEPVRRYQRARPGELIHLDMIHLDINKLGRFDRPGHRVTGTRTGCRNRGQAGTSSMSRSMTRPGSPMSRFWATSARPPPASSCAPCAGSDPRASRSNG